MTKRKNRPDHVIAEDAAVLQDLIDKWGGMAQFGVRIGLRRSEASSKLHDWLRNGIPDHYKVKFPEMFMPHLFEGGYPYPKRKREPEKD